MFQFPSFAPYTYVFSARYPTYVGWVSPFGHRRIKAYCQLPDAFRRLSRPSSPLTAKASTMCAYSLDHITPSCLGMTRIPANGISISLSIRQLALPALASRHVMDIRLKRSLHPDFQRTCPSLNARASQSVCAQSFRDTSWWVWEDSNHRPRPYQGRALTT